MNPEVFSCPAPHLGTANREAPSDSKTRLSLGSCWHKMPDYKCPTASKLGGSSDSTQPPRRGPGTPGPLRAGCGSVRAQTQATCPSPTAQSGW